MNKFKEDDLGMLEWVETNKHGAGYWRRVEDPERTKDRTPRICAACARGLDNWSVEKFYYRNGVCADCSIEYLEGRFPDGHFKKREDKLVYVKQQIAAKAAHIKEKLAEEDKTR